MAVMRSLNIHKEILQARIDFIETTIQQRNHMPENSATRAHAIFSLVRNIKNINSVKAWGTAFGNPELQPAEVTSQLVELHRQLEDVEEQIKQKYSTEAANVKLKHIPALKQSLFTGSLTGTINLAKELMTDAALDSLEALSHDIADETKIPESELEKISDSIEGLFREIESSGLHKKLKTFLMKMLERIRRAIAQYRISGAKGLQEALVAMQGEADLFYPAIDKVKKEAPGLWSKLSAFFSGVVITAAFLNACTDISESKPVSYAVEFGLNAARYLEDDHSTQANPDDVKKLPSP